MIKISKKIEYSLIALKYIHQKDAGELTSAREVVDKFKLPFDTTAKVLQQLNMHKILNSIQGPKGGYFLEKSLEEISYMDLCRIIEKKSFFINCSPCDLADLCNISQPLKNLNNSITAFFESLTLAQLLDNPSLISKTQFEDQEVSI